MTIDRIARAMVDVEPSGDLESRIHARLDEARPRRTMAWWSWRVGVPLAAAAAIAITFVVQGPGSRVQGPGSRVQGPESRVQGPESRGPAPVASPVPNLASSAAPNLPSSPVPHVRSSPVPQFPTSPLSSVEMAWMERRMPALDPVLALQMDQLRVASIQPEPLAITPLTMTMLGADGAGIDRIER